MSGFSPAPERAATLLGAAHTARGAFDEGSPDAGSVRAAARAQLGDEALEAAYQQGRDLGNEAALTLVRDVLAAPGSFLAATAPLYYR